MNRRIPVFPLLIALSLAFPVIYISYISYQLRQVSIQITKIRESQNRKMVAQKTFVPLVGGIVPSSSEGIYLSYDAVKNDINMTYGRGGGKRATFLYWKCNPSLYIGISLYHGAYCRICAAQKKAVCIAWNHFCWFGMHNQLSWDCYAVPYPVSESNIILMYNHTS